MNILIDTREQKPWLFDTPFCKGLIKREQVKLHQATLAIGDYEVTEVDGRCVIERKSIDDLMKCLFHDKERFKSQLKRMRQIKYRCLVVEGDITAIRRHLESGKSKAHINAVLSIMAHIEVRYDVPIRLWGGRTSAMEQSLRWMVQHAKHHILY